MSYRLLPQPVPLVGDRAMCGVLADRPVNLVRTSAGKPLGVRPPRRAKRDGELSVHIRQVFEDYFGVYARRFTSFQTRRRFSSTAVCLMGDFIMLAAALRSHRQLHASAIAVCALLFVAAANISS